MPRIAKPIGSLYTNPNGTQYIKIDSTGTWSKDWQSYGKYVVEQFLKRKLKPSEKIIKINGQKNDVRIENLLLLDIETKNVTWLNGQAGITTKSAYEWSRLHSKCTKCQTTQKKHAAFGLCTSCYHSQTKLSSYSKSQQFRSRV